MDTLTFAVAMVDATIECELFVTSDGYFGCGSPFVKTGDIVVFLMEPSHPCSSRG